MCAVCFTAAQVVPLGALYARARYVKVRVQRGADATPEEQLAPVPPPRDDVLASAR